MIIITTMIATILATSTSSQDNAIYEASDKAKTIRQANESLKRIKG